MTLTLLDRIERLEAEGPIDVSTIDPTVNNPPLVKQRFGPAISYGEGVEIEVPTTAKVVRTILPNMSEEQARFVDIWDIQETEHGVLLAIPREACDIEPIPNRDSVPALMKLTGSLAKVSPGAHDMIEMIYLTEGAGGELETLLFYLGLKEGLTEIDEIPAATLVGKIATQEAAHLAYYRQGARKKAEELTPWQLHFVQQFILRTYMPVGVRISKRDVERQRNFGEVAVLMGDERRDFTIDQVEKLARTLLKLVEENPDPFLRRRYQQCIEEYEESIAA